MADNFLEKQMEQYRSGKPVVRKVNPSLDSLLHKLAEQDRSGEEIHIETDPALIVRNAQFEAALRSARMVFGDEFKAEISEAEQCIRIDSGSCRGSLEGIILAVRLKAAELGLRTSTKQPEGLPATIYFFR